jgi:hypothetical protein
MLHCSLLRNPWPNLAGMLEHCCKGETNCCLSIFRDIFMQQRTSMYIFLLSVAILINSENFLNLLRRTVWNNLNIYWQSECYSRPQHGIQKIWHSGMQRPTPVFV